LWKIDYKHAIYLSDFGSRRSPCWTPHGQRLAALPMKDFADKLGVPVSSVTAQTSIKTNESEMVPIDVLTEVNVRAKRH
jgi:hypothetical protein